MTFPGDVQRRMYALMVLMKAADDRLSKGIGTGEFMCVYWPSRGQEAVGAPVGVSLRPRDPVVAASRRLAQLLREGGPLGENHRGRVGGGVGGGRRDGWATHIP